MKPSVFIHRAGGRWEAVSTHNDNGNIVHVVGTGYSVPQALAAWVRKSGYRRGEYRVIEDRS